MKKTARNTSFKVVMMIITAICIAFAFVQSLMTDNVSEQESSAVMVFLQNLFNIFGVNATLTEHIVRKAGHFIEFFVIGAMMMNTGYAFNKARPYKYYWTILFVGLFTSVIDEAIKLNVSGRSCEVTDVLIDFAGVLVGSVIMLLILTIYKKIRRI